MNDRGPQQQYEVNSSGMRPTPTAALTQLLAGLFSNAAQISAFVRSFSGLRAVATSLPSDSVSVDDMAFALACRLSEHNLVNREFFLALIRVRPFQSAQIKHAANICGIEINIPPQLDPWSRRTQLVVASLGLLALLFAAGGLLRRDSESPPPLAPTSSEKPTSPPAPAPADKWDVSMIPDKIVVEGSGSLDTPAPPASQPVTPVISLGEDELEPVILTVVSPASGAARLVSLSKHRSTASAAQGIFAALKLGNDPDSARAMSYDQYALCQEQQCYTTESVAAVIDLTKPVFYKRRQTEWTADRSTPAKITTSNGDSRAPNPFIFPGDAEELFRSGEPWLVNLYASLYAQEYPKIPDDRERTYTFKLSLCPDGTIKPAKHHGTGSSKLDAQIAAEIRKSTTTQAVWISELLGGKCRMILYTFSLKLTKRGVRIK